ncbi:hypothetical protein A3A75_02420 [Candidatus Woesebacteria bacterium RIFCSPLOWO2_01_FULL_39_10]|uniref:Uncharacterized protein n=1 Tax=Candidatus Woesebacteria bacterium RIFCSPLOWO2_01_FULL_39_10 TaxID=1802516 RepID=A0A1F8BA59_9BACT|nr:MAG: hypothetical protein A3A75_02420 [Candidatus Woesebacteria bacterium RIFCSPLOWO2_01_FULL_39_10]
MLLSILVAMAIFAILAHALFTIIASSFELVSFNKARVTARHLAQEKIELIRNLSYADVGTVGGIPDGILTQQEDVVRNGLNYIVKTDVLYVDDSYDNVAPTDTSPEDYKRARVEVSWAGLAASRKNPVVLITDISAFATAVVDGGTLIILVFDSNGDPVSQADVTIVSSGITPSVNLTTKTDSNGGVVIPGATPCIECYKITVTKTGMSTDRTYSTSEVTNPLKPYASIFQDDVTQISFTIDDLGNLNISSVDSRENNFNPLGNVSFRLYGNKIVGTDAFAQPVYKYDQTLITNGSGTLALSSMEWDVYRVEMPASTSYDISGASPLLPLYLTPGGSLDFTFATDFHTDHSFFLTVKDPAQNLIASSSASLSDGSSYDETKFTGDSGNPDHGQVLFSNLTEQIYNLVATASGFVDFTGDFDVSGYTKADVVLAP